MSFNEKYVVITRKYVVLTRKDLVITRKYVVLTRKDLVITRKYVVLTRKRYRYYEKICRFNEKRSRYNDIIEWKKYYVGGSIIEVYRPIPGVSNCRALPSLVPTLLQHTHTCSFHISLND